MKPNGPRLSLEAHCKMSSKESKEGGLHPAMEVAKRSVVPPISPKSPTGITNSVRRPVQVARATTGGFLAAEQFSKNVDKINGLPGSPLMIRERHNGGGLSEFANLNCSTPFRAAQSESYAMYQPDLSAFQSTSNSPGRMKAPLSSLNSNTRSIASQREEYAMYRPDLSASKSTSNSPGRMKVPLSNLSCNTSFNATESETFATYQSGVSASQSTRNSPGRTKAPLGILNCSTPVNAAESERFATYQPDASDFRRKTITFQDAKEGCFNPMVAHTKMEQEKFPSKEKLKSCLTSRKDQAQDCANGTYGMYLDSCGAENHRGGNEEFFMNPGANPQAPHSPIKAPQDLDESRAVSRGRNKTREARSLRRVDSIENTTRTRSSFRFPKVALADDPFLSSPLSSSNVQDFEEDAASILDIPPVDIPPVGNTQSALRDYRLSLLFNSDKIAQVLRRSTSSPALNELELHDGTVGDLNEDLLQNKEELTSMQVQLKHNETSAVKHQTAITDLKSKFVTEKQDLHDRLQRESEENSKLYKKLSSLQLEVSQLHSNLRSTKSELKKTSTKWVEESRNEVTSKVSGRSADLSVEDTALVVTLRSEISDLKNQLDNARMYENRTVDSREYDHSDVMRLKSHLERAEVELLRLKEVQMAAVPDTATEELKAALEKSEEALLLAAEKEQMLAEELEDTQAVIASHEASSLTRHNVSLLEAQGLKERLGKLEDEAEKAQKTADEALELCRVEADELRLEIQRLSQALEEETHRALCEASERVKGRLEFEYKLEKKDEEGKSFEEKIKKLEASLATAEKEALSISVQSTERSVKRKLESGTSRGCVSPVLLLEPYGRDIGIAQIMPGVERLQQDLRTKETEESILKAELALLSDKVRSAEATASKVQVQADSVTKEAETKSADRERELKELRAQLAEQTTKSNKTNQEREHFQDEFEKLKQREHNLENEMSTLKSRLESAETKVNNEMFRAEEERRMAVETDAERLEEISRIKAELQRAKTVQTSPDAMDELVSRIYSAEKELEKFKTAEKELKFKEISGSNSDKDDLDTLRSVREMVNANGTASPMSCYDDMSYSRSMASTASPLSMPSNFSSPKKTRNRSRSSSVSSNTWSPKGASDQPASNKSSPPRTSDLASPPRRTNRSTSSTHTGPNGSSSVTLSPFSPLRPNTLSSRPSNGTALTNVEEEDDASAEIRAGMENISKIPSKRLDIAEIQRRLLDSTKRLTDAKSKLRVLVEATDEHKEEQNKIKSSVDGILDRMSEQAKKATQQQSVERGTTTPNRTSEAEHSPQHSPQHSNALRSMRSTEQVLERYRKYKSSRHQMFQAKTAAAADDLILAEEGEI